MLPRDWVYGGWRRSGEIDIMESRGMYFIGTVEDSSFWFYLNIKY